MAQPKPSKCWAFYSVFVFIKPYALVFLNKRCCLCYKGRRRWGMQGLDSIGVVVKGCRVMVVPKHLEEPGRGIWQDIPSIE